VALRHLLASGSLSVQDTSIHDKASMAGKARRTKCRGTAGRKLYAVRDAEGWFKDMQTYERTHRADLGYKPKTEVAAGRARTAKNKTAAKE
jgi:hypothetical protein